MRRVVVLALVSAVTLTACGSDEPADLSLQGEGLVGEAPARLEVAGLGQPLPADETGSAEDDGPGCVERARVAAGGTGEDGSPRWFVTLELAQVPADETALVQVLGEDTCIASRRALMEHVAQRLGAVGPEALDVSYRDPEGRRWLLS